MWSCMSERASAYLHGGRVLSMCVAVTTCLLGERGNRREALHIPTSLLSDFRYASGTLARLCPRATGAQVFDACTCALVHAEGLSKAPDEHWPGIIRSTPVPFKLKLVVMDLESGICNKRLGSGVHYNVVHQTKVKRSRWAFRKGKETVETEFNWSLTWLCTILYGEQICTTRLPEQLPKPIWETHGNMELFLSAVKGGDSRTLITLLMDDYQCKECVRLQLGSTYLR